ncbi:carboxylesterase [Alteribacillus persepolensis]|uniref:Carboxylesterase n=1 Tax=Alteribacillus persepolensis TaxID=568899 RepID=A0A1G8AKZ6_9BACI|nr:carboxylesterase [Alteribacillus persepolensis]SDH21539.1 carboxylesterase [Alteribacillus persepolensis]
MKIVPPKPFKFEGGKRAVLLLHAFTGSSADVRMLGRYLQKRGYTCHAPIYTGHGVPPEELFQSNSFDWWQDVERAWQELRNDGYEEIAVAGLSLGGLMTLKVAYTYPVKGIIPMCAPMIVSENKDRLYKGVLRYAKEYKQLENKDEKQVEKEMEEFKDLPTDTLSSVNELIEEVRDSLDMIYAPAFIVQAEKDDMVPPESAQVIHDEIASDEKHLKWYEESGHVITMDKERDQLHEDVYQFLEQLDWETDK